MTLPAVEKRFEYKGFPCVVLMQPLCFRTGYVGIPKGHRYYEKNYDNIMVDCHGGLTYSDNSLCGQTDEETWWIGFDTGHYRDGYDFEAAERLFADDEEVMRQIAAIKNTFLGADEWLPMSLEYCENECKRIVDQIIEN